MDWDVRLTNKMIMWTLGIVLILGLLNSAFLLNPPKEVGDLIPKSQTRTPASTRLLTAENDLLLKTKKFAIRTLKINCAPKFQLDVPFQVNQVKLIGSQCGVSMDSAKDFTLINKSNGFTGTIFKNKENSFVSDLIQLSPGMNHIVLNATASDGSSLVSEIKLQRIKESVKK